MPHGFDRTDRTQEIIIKFIKNCLFTDGSVDPRSGTGYGAYFLVSSDYLSRPLEALHEKDIIPEIKIKKFKNTSSTQLEIETLLWAIHEIKPQAMPKDGEPLRIFTDSQAISRLLNRREALEEKKFYSKRGQAELTHAALYRKYYAHFDEMGFEVTKVPGHAPKRKHTSIDRIFSCVDQTVRATLQEHSS